MSHMATFTLSVSGHSRKGAGGVCVLCDSDQFRVLVEFDGDDAAIEDVFCVECGEVVSAYMDGRLWLTLAEPDGDGP